MSTVDEQTRLREQVEAIEKEIRETPYHKATEHHIGKLRAKLSKLRAKQQDTSSKKGGGGGGYGVKKHGDATVVLVGPPSAGKSTLLNRLTNAQSKVASYAFTTLNVIPGMMIYKNARIQILDVPGLIEGAEEGKGRGREVLSVARGADLIILMTDVKRLQVLKNIETALEKNGVRLNQKPPGVVVEKKLSGGIIIHTNLSQPVSKQTIKEIAHEMGIKNAEITLKEKLDMGRLIDAFATNRVYTPAFNLINKIDLDEKLKSNSHNTINISAEEGIGIEKLKEKIWKALEFVTIYLVRQDEDPSENNPMIVRAGDKLSAVARKIGEEFAEDHKRARIWGPGAKFAGQEVSLSKEVMEGMKIRFI